MVPNTNYKADPAPLELTAGILINHLSDKSLGNDESMTPHLSVKIANLDKEVLWTVVLPCVG